MTTDVDNFFPSMSVREIELIFTRIGYSKRLSNLLAKLCCRDGSLPQGAPTSPALSNIFMIPFDDAISSYCKKLNIKYTRYADDLTFSGDFDTDATLEVVKTKIGELGLSLNADKTKIMGRDQAQLVTGVVVNEKLQVAFKKRNKFETRNVLHQ